MSNLSSITLKAPAKVNFRLKILSKLSSGYHTLESIMQPLDLHDQISMAWEKGPKGKIRFECSDTSLPKDSRNLAYRAAEIMLTKGQPAGQLHLRLIKWIPSGAGLGGGSSDAAAVILGLNSMLDLGLSDVTMMEIGAELGMDVPFFIKGVPGLVTGCGEEVLPIEVFPETHLLLLVPQFQVSTQWAYEALDFGLTRRKRTAKLPPFFEAGPALIDWVRNDLQAPVAAKHEEIGAMRKALTDAGALVAEMSGSGSVVFGLFEDHASAERASHEIKAPTGCRVVVAKGERAAASP